ncbi:hypothetical protein KIPB_009472, partial [Kipferlia bialata]
IFGLCIGGSAADPHTFIILIYGMTAVSLSWLYIAAAGSFSSGTLGIEASLLDIKKSIMGGACASATGGYSIAIVLMFRSWDNILDGESIVDVAVDLLKTSSHVTLRGAGILLGFMLSSAMAYPFAVESIVGALLIRGNTLRYRARQRYLEAEVRYVRVRAQRLKSHVVLEHIIIPKTEPNSPRSYGSSSN